VVKLRNIGKLCKLKTPSKLTKASLHADDT